VHEFRGKGHLDLVFLFFAETFLQIPAVENEQILKFGEIRPLIGLG